MPQRDPDSVFVLEPTFGAPAYGTIRSIFDWGAIDHGPHEQGETALFRTTSSTIDIHFLMTIGEVTNKAGCGPKRNFWTPFEVQLDCVAEEIDSTPRIGLSFEAIESSRTGEIIVAPEEQETKNRIRFLVTLKFPKLESGLRPESIRPHLLVNRSNRTGELIFQINKATVSFY